MTHHPPSRGVRKPRKSRGRGLRATTGCLVCKRRHVKCDEARPSCGPCAKGQRDCVYATSPPLHESQDETHSTPLSAQVHQPLQVLVDACEHQRPESPAPLTTSPKLDSQRSLAPDFAISHAHATSPISPQEYVPSPSTESVGSGRHAPLNWFELLASDAVNSNQNFYLSPQQTVAQPAETLSLDPYDNPGFQPRTPRERESFRAASFNHDPELQKRLTSTSQNSDAQLLPDEPSAWTAPSQIQLTDREIRIFHHFVRILGGYLDYFDPARHFSAVVPHLALRNAGLMKALLAVSVRHIALWNTDPEDPSIQDSRRPVFWKELALDPYFRCLDRNIAVQYYYETLSYLNKAMHYQSYARSPELISTALLISLYEMVDGSNRDWERHLKGVFWIQRCQNNDGECGGLRQAVWWAWLRQDAWVAMRERRRVFTFWRPKRPISSLSPAELACFAHYLLAQCVNYASREECETKSMQQRLDRGNELLYMLQEWQNCLPPEFGPLPIAQKSEVFPPIWVHPPAYAAALQVHSLARVLVILHRPSIGGLQDYRAAQGLLSISVNTICGLARTVSEDDDAGSLVSLNCLFGAGMSVSTPHERAELLDLIETFQKRVRWPNKSLRKDLESEYQKDALSGFTG
ncbi:Zn(II)2Cys6 transcription factor [Aspergillus ambiguus]|uniref:Zn(II)2Cys6 transcription factor n=1 Tax=Aspergillus ambiguus TaxID=176160 RepID=UPI003CCD5881